METYGYAALIVYGGPAGAVTAVVLTWFAVRRWRRKAITALRQDEVAAAPDAHQNEW